ncbi:hypothetical protein [Amycolatopsis alkalitolerans]|uniref:hypothetical protein n=1 Tax=Amycolatopsis alkalitolerans TaxID=2547244 RepID=UPI001F46A1F1|nr:hypothetical protein [Amycolatopsis alkalitolerans]
MEVVSMARQPEVFVNELEPEQAQRLVKITRSMQDRVRLRRAGIVLASVQGQGSGKVVFWRVRARVMARSGSRA